MQTPEQPVYANWPDIPPEFEPLALAGYKPFFDEESGQWLIGDQGDDEPAPEAAMSLPLDPEEKPHRERTSAGPPEHGTGTSVMTTPGDFTPEPPPTRHKKPVKKTVKTSKAKRRLGKRLRVRKKWADE